MVRAIRDENREVGLLGETSLGTGVPVTVYVDPTTHRLYVDSLLNSDSAVQTMNRYGANNIAEPSATITYVGKETKDADWLVQKIDTSSDTALTYATILNNPTVTTYADAWTARASTLVYGTYSQAF